MKNLRNGLRYNSTLSLISAVDWVSVRHASAALPPWIRAENNCAGGCVGPRAGLDGCGYFANTGIRSPEHPASSESLYWLRSPGPHLDGFQQFNETDLSTCLLPTRGGDIRLPARHATSSNNLTDTTSRWYCKYLLTYLLAYLLTCLLTCLLTYLLIWWLTCLLT
jgi:hypothetical protein